ncbi:MAG TPA: hypothetical protein DD745_02995 [Bacteroidales bacterium]|nr:hypothetical protein [Bacteroidales bacterium]
MKILITYIALITSVYLAEAQNKNAYQQGISAEENLRAISNLSATSIGGIGFDTRYKGIRGSPMLFDTLLISFLKISNQDKYIQLESNIDLVSNSVHFVHPKTKQMVALSGNKITEIIISSGNNDLIFRTMEGSLLKKDAGDYVFYQVLNDDPYQLIKVPSKEFIEADYKQAYSPGRQFDEFNTTYKYYIISDNGTINPCQLTERSLAKLFPDKKKIIDNVTKGKSYTDKEAMVMDILKNF